jgi:hypothetical protein
MKNVNFWMVASKMASLKKYAVEVQAIFQFKVNSGNFLLYIKSGQSSDNFLL